MHLRVQRHCVFVEFDARTLFRNIVKINAGIQYSLQSTDLAKNRSLNKLCYLCWYYRQEKVSSQFKIGLDHFLFVWLPKCVPYTRNNKRSFRLFVPFQSSFRVFVPFSSINVPILPKYVPSTLSFRTFCSFSIIPNKRAVPFLSTNVPSYPIMFQILEIMK